MKDNTMHLNLMENRFKMYNLLSRLYRYEVDEHLLAQLQTMEFPKTCMNEVLSEGYSELSEVLRDCHPETLLDLEVDYAKVFIGAGIANSKAAYPYESVYTSPKGMMMQEARDQVRDIYEQKGMQQDKSKFNVPEDHIALELEYMACLCKEAHDVIKRSVPTELSACLTEQMDFLESHLENWVPSLCADIDTYAQKPFYKAVGKVTRGYLQHECHTLKSLMREYKTH